MKRSAKQVCSVCNGKGCDHCHQGVTTVVLDEGQPSSLPDRIPCPVCHGASAAKELKARPRGNQDDCPRCHGAGYVSKYSHEEYLACVGTVSQPNSDGGMDFVYVDEMGDPNEVDWEAVSRLGEGVKSAAGVMLPRQGFPPEVSRAIKEALGDESADVRAVPPMEDHIVPATETVKHDAGKPRMELLPAGPLAEIAKVLTFGAGKYGDHNWRLGTDWSRFVGAARRHIDAWNEGEDLDAESGLSHLAHAACCLIFLLDYQARNAGKDDRWKP